MACQLVSLFHGYEGWMLHQGRMRSTVRSHRGKLALLLPYLEECGVTEPADLTREIVPVIEAWLMDRGVTPQTRGTYISAFKGFSSYLVAEHHLLFDVAKHLKTPKTKRTQRRVPSRQEIKRLIESVDDSTPTGMRNRLLLEIAYYTGMRSGEISDLRWDDIDFTRRSIRFFGKGEVERQVFFPETTAKRLKTFLKASDHPQVFCGASGNILSMRVTKMVKKAGMAYSGIHFLRYSIATHLYEAGANVRSIQVMLGHRHLPSTYEYIRPRLDYLKEMHRRHHPFQRGFL